MSVQPKRPPLASNQPSSAAIDSSPKQEMSLGWIDDLKAIAIIGILLIHITERIFGFPLIGYPTVDWPPMAERLAQLQPLVGQGIWDIPINLFRYGGWAGNQVVQLFIILSGFGLTTGLLRRRATSSTDFSTRLSQQPIAWIPFFQRRVLRIYPLWWAAHFFFIAIWMVTGRGLTLENPATYWSLLGVRFTPDLFYYFNPSWWFVGLILQFYLVYPLLWIGLNRLGVRRFLGFTILLAFAARAVGLYGLGDDMDKWLWGAVFITRLPEFVVGMGLAVWFHRDQQRLSRRLRSPMVVAAAIATFVIGYGLALTRIGMIAAPFLIGVGEFVWLYAVLTVLGRVAPSFIQNTFRWLGRRSYILFLTHQPFIFMALPEGATGKRAVIGCIAALVCTAIVSLILEGGLYLITQFWQANVKLVGRSFLMRGLGVVGAIALLGLTVTELSIRHIAPQNVMGWAERASLSPHPTFDWSLTPSQKTHLRWESYDYHVTANALGFPGPEYPVAKSSDTLRVLVTGDAFSSAEGVDTEDAWPRLLEYQLADRLPNRTVEVMNFSITGYGPNQYAAVVDEFAPRYRPDLILVEFFVNDFEDVLFTPDEFHQSIGFHLPPQDGWFAQLNPFHSQQLFEQRVTRPLLAQLRGKPEPTGYFFGNVRMLDRRRDGEGVPEVTQRLQQIKATADQVGANVAIAMVPASVQVCQPDQLPYYPKAVDLSDRTTFDLDLPQRMAQSIAQTLGVGFYDLRDPLKATSPCPYQPHNMHWLEHGHQAVATALAETLTTDGYTSSE